MTFFAGRGDLEVGVVHLVVLDRVLRVTTKKTFLKEKSAPQTKTRLRLCYEQRR